MTTKKTEPETTQTTFERLAEVQQGVTCQKTQTGKTDKYSYQYRSAADIIAAAKPLLLKVGAAITLNMELLPVGNNVYIHAVAQFYNSDTGETVSASAYARENLGNMKLDPSQATGSATTYARKYALEGLLLLDEAEHDPDSRVHEPEPVVVPVDPLVVANHLLALQTAMDSGNNAAIRDATNAVPIVQRRAVWDALNDKHKAVIQAAKDEVGG
jgi:hypothetical protein